MKIAELHPEHLLDKHALGELTASEREQLDLHVAKCATCRFEVQARADFTDEMAHDDERVSGMIRLALETAKTNEVKAPPPPPPSIKSSRRRPWAPWLIAAAAMLVAIGAAASESGRKVWVPIFLHDSAPAAPQPLADEVERKQQQPRAIVAPTPVQTATAPIETATAPIETATAPTVVASPTPSALLDAESDARRRGDYERVLQLHRELIAGHPRSHEAQTSRVTVARMLLDRGDASGALAGFDAYLANGSGELGEDALAGRASALERLGRTDEARSAWSKLLETYPSSAYAAHAKARLEATGPSAGGDDPRR